MALLRARWKHWTDLWHPDSSAHSSTATDRCIPAFHALVVREGGSLWCARGAPIARQVRVRKRLTQEQHFWNEKTLFRSSTSVVNHPEENTVTHTEHSRDTQSGYREERTTRWVRWSLGGKRLLMPK